MFSTNMCVKKNYTYFFQCELPCKQYEFIPIKKKKFSGTSKNNLEN